MRPSIVFRLRGTKSNRDAIGAAVTVHTESLRQTRSLQAGSGFLSQHSKDIFFGLGDTKSPVRASIRWPSGTVQELPDLPINHTVWVEEGSSQVRTEPFRSGKSRAEHPGSASALAEPLPAIAETWLLAPVAAPDFTLQELKGQPFTLAALRGKPVLLNFWTSMSAECVAQLKAFDESRERWARQGLQLLTINVDDPADAGAAQALTDKHRLSLPILRGSDDVKGIYNILYRYLFDRHRDLGLPTSLLDQ